MQITVEEEWDAVLDRILGDRLLFDLDEPQQHGGHQSQRSTAGGDGRIEFTKSGALSKLNRPMMKKVMKGVALTPA